MKLMKGNRPPVGRGRPRLPGDATGSAIVVSPGIALTRAAPAEAAQNVSTFRGCCKPQQGDVLEFLVEDATEAIQAGVCCECAQACQETGAHRHGPDESPERPLSSVRAAALLSHPLRGPISCEKNSLPAKRLAHFHSRYSTFSPPGCLPFSPRKQQVLSEVPGRDRARAPNSPCASPLSTGSCPAFALHLRLDPLCSQYGFGSASRSVVGFPARALANHELSLFFFFCFWRLPL